MVESRIMWFTDSSKSSLPVPLILFQRTFWHLLSDLGLLPSLWFYPNYGTFLPAPSLSYAILTAVGFFCQLIFPSHGEALPLSEFIQVSHQWSDLLLLCSPYIHRSEDSKLQNKKAQGSVFPIKWIISRKGKHLEFRFPCQATGSKGGFIGQTWHVPVYLPTSKGRKCSWDQKVPGTQHSLSPSWGSQSATLASCWHLSLWMCISVTSFSLMSLLNSQCLIPKSRVA